MKTRYVKMLVALLFTMATTLGAVGCKENDNAFEETGEKVDEAVHDTERAVEDAVD